MPRITDTLVFFAPLYLLCIGWNTSTAQRFEVREVIDPNVSFRIDDRALSFPTDYNSELYFVARGEETRNLYRTDGSNVVELELAVPDNVRSFPAGLTVFDGSLFLTDYSGGGRDLYRITDAAVTRIPNARPLDGWTVNHFLGPYPPAEFQVFRDELFFFRENHLPTDNVELVKFDSGSTDEVLVVGQIGSCCPHLVAISEGQMIFSAADFPSDGGLLTFSDGDSLASVQIEDHFARFGHAVSVDEVLYYADEAEAGYILRGQSVDKSTLVAALPPESPHVAALGDAIYFSSDGPSGWELYRRDESGVDLVADINPQGDSFPRSFFVAENTVFFEATLPDGPFLYSLQGEELRRVGAVDVFLGDVDERARDRQPFREYAGGVLFSGQRENGVELFWTDGVALKELDVLEGPDSSYAGLAITGGPGDNFYVFDAISEFGDRLLFSAKSEAGFDVFSFDGKSIQQETDLGITSPVEAPSHFVQIGGRMFFIAGGGLFQLSLIGDYSDNGFLDASDIDVLGQHVMAGLYVESSDLNMDGTVDISDRRFFIETLADTFFGDSNLDGAFDSSDLVEVFTAGEYEDATEDNSGWAEGDWDGDGDFTTGDLVVAFQDGGYELGPRVAANAVPEPTSLVMLVSALIGIAFNRRTHKAVGHVR